jgi:hypothetical protein
MQLKTQAFLGLAELIDLALPQIATKLGEQGLKMASQDYTLDYPNGETASAEGFILTFQCVGLAAAKKKAASVAPAQLPAPAPAEDIKPVAGDKVPMTTAQRIAKMNAARLEKRAEKLATTAEAVVETSAITQVETVETPPPNLPPVEKCADGAHSYIKHGGKHPVTGQPVAFKLCRDCGDRIELAVKNDLANEVVAASDKTFPGAYPDFAREQAAIAAERIANNHFVTVTGSR